ncbi:MAG: hypothetical protein ACFFG0_34655 [Candidatus Thorarchaeota archaeon]
MGTRELFLLSNISLGVNEDSCNNNFKVWDVNTQLKAKEIGIERKRCQKTMLNISQRSIEQLCTICDKYISQIGKSLLKIIGKIKASMIYGLVYLNK